MWNTLDSGSLENGLVNSILDELQYLFAPDTVHVHSLTDETEKSIVCFNGLVHSMIPCSL